MEDIINREVDYMSKTNENNELLNKIIDLNLIYEIKDSELYLKFLDNQIKFYQSQIGFLEDTKPLFFQKKKLEEHNKKIESYEQKISNAYKKMNEEAELIIEMQKNLNS